MGYEMTEDIEHSDLVFLNTCTVREGAATKVYGKLGDLKRIKEEKDGHMIIGVTGCLAQEVRDEFIKEPLMSIWFWEIRILEEFLILLKELKKVKKLI